MKRLRWAMICGVLMLAAGAIGAVLLLRTQSEPPPRETPSTPTETVPAPTAAVAAPSLKDVYPNVDGSTATLPLAQSIWAAATGSSAPCPVVHNKTHNAYVNLIHGLADLILVTEPSAHELQMASALDVALEVVPVVAEGFVFLVNGENPVTSLTRAQIRDIYAGEIVNWAQLGGNDLPIVPYQRPENSGSQTGMTSLVMGGAQLMSPPTELVLASMGGLVDAVADYHNSAGAIGYSYYYYVTDMYRAQNIKLLSLDGVAPTAANIAGGLYPYGTAYYAVLRADTPPSHPARALLAFLLSEAGQDAASRAGYIPLDLTRDAPVPSTPVAALSPCDTYPVYDIQVSTVYQYGAPDEWGNPSSRIRSVQVDGLWDTAVQTTVNAAIAAHIAALPAGDFSVYYDQFAGLLSLCFSWEDRFHPLTLNLTTGEPIGILDLFGSEDAAQEALRGAALHNILNLYLYNDDIEAAASHLLASFGALSSVKYSISASAIQFYSDVGYDTPYGWRMHSVSYPVAACRDFLGYHKFVNPIAPVLANPFVWLDQSPKYRGGRFLYERQSIPKRDEGNWTPWEREAYAYLDMRAQRAIDEVEALFAATPQDMGRFDKYSVHGSTWPMSYGVRLIEVREQRIGFTVPRTDWDTLWQKTMLGWYLRRGYSADWDYLITLSDFLNHNGLPLPDTLHETHITYCVDPMTGKEYRTLSDYFQPGYDAAAVLLRNLPRLREELRPTGLDDAAFMAQLMPVYSHGEFVFYFSVQCDLRAAVIPFSQFDATKLSVPFLPESP